VIFLSNTAKIYEIRDIKLDQYHISLNEALFHNANGYIGIRYDFEEGYPEEISFVPSQYINGFYDYTPMRQAEKLYGLVNEKQTMLNIANTQPIKLWIDNEPFSMFSGTVLSSRLRLDMDKGITVRHVIWRSPLGKELELTVTRMASFHQLSLFTIEYEVLPLNFSGEVKIESGHLGDVKNYADPHDPRMANEPIKYLTPIMIELQNGISFITSITSRSNLEVCSCVRNVLRQEHRQEFIVDGQNALCQFETEVVQGKKLELIKYAVFCDTIRYANAKKQAELEIKQALAQPLSDLYKKQAEYLSEYWQNFSVEIEGDPELNMATHYSLYQLIQAAGKDPYCCVAPKGLSGDGYEGHYFWDSEMYIQPFFTVTNPDLARNLLEYRYATLDLARENARILGHQRGALYPWRTITGKECSGFFPSGSAQYHINGDIAYAVVAYYLATKDLAFLEQKGAEIIWETARLWLETGNYYQGKFHINDVTGPDEYTCIVNNNYYTNIMAQYNLRWAVKIYQLLKESDYFDALIEKLDLKEEEIISFQKAADNMYLPYDEQLKINPQDDSFLQKRKWDLASIPKDKFPLLVHYHPLHLYRHQICKQADTIMAYVLVEEAQSEETMANSFRYYEKITTHDSSLSYCMFSIMAARLGMVDKAYSYYELTAKLDLTDAHGNTDDGIHVANMGGNYLAIVYGFGGFRLKEEGVLIAPILPRQWTGYSFKLSFEGSRIKVSVGKDRCIIKLESGAAKKITVYDHEYLLADTLVIDRPTHEHNQPVEGGDNDEV
jgi:alpha,alpha-trehalose phosphorylase